VGLLIIEHKLFKNIKLAGRHRFLK
jgi:hypothetical protein